MATVYKNSKKLIIANWKMNGSIEKIIADLNVYAQNLDLSNHDIVLALPYPYLYLVLGQKRAYNIAAQDISRFAAYGAHTGEVSATMLLEFGVKYVLIGHSERRLGLNETCDILLEKLKNALKLKMVPIFCVGEERLQRDNGNYEDFLRQQLDILLACGDNLEELVIAYEPVWAIGSGVLPTGNEIAIVVELIHVFMQKYLPHVKIALLYGGSVNMTNSANIFAIKGIDGILVGAASLDPHQFISICKTAK